MPANLDDIHEFLAQRRIALVGVSRDPKDFSRTLFREMCRRGYDMVPVNPGADDIAGRRCFARVQEIEPPVAAVLIMTPPRETQGVVRDCAAAGVQRVWMHSGGGQGAVSKGAADFCRQQGMRLVEGHCPLMFLTATSFIHRLHGFVLKVVRRYPAEARPAA